MRSLGAIFRTKTARCCVAMVAASALGASVVNAQCLAFSTELTSMTLSGGPFPIPLATDPSNLLGDSVDGYGFVDSLVTITLSSQRIVSPGPNSLGLVYAVPAPGPAVPCPGTDPIVPGLLDGQLFAVESFFDAFYDITVTDVDSRPGRDYAGQPDGASIVLLDNGPSQMASSYQAIFDAGAPNFGLFPPPEANPYTSAGAIEIPLGGDINGNGENDKVKITLFANAAGDSNRTFTELPNGTVLNEFDAAAYLTGTVVDMSSDPPFTIGASPPALATFGGPTVATSDLQNQVAGPQCLNFSTELTSMTLSGGPFPIPLANDPGNSLGDSVDGYGFVDSLVTITLSSQRAVSPGPGSFGLVYAALAPGPAVPCPGTDPIVPGLLDGQTFDVGSFFAVFYDITLTDVDSRPGRDYAGQPDGASIVLPDNGPTQMASLYQAVFDAVSPNFGLFPPPEAAPYTNNGAIQIPLGGDINGNGEDDKVKITLFAAAAGDSNRLFTELPNGTVLNEFDAAAYLAGTVVDMSSDPPFSIGASPPALATFGGPAVATSDLQNRVADPSIPATSPVGLVLLGLILLLLATAFLTRGRSILGA